MQKLILSVLLLVLAGVVGYFYVLPAYTGMQQLQKEKTALRSVLDEYGVLTEKKKELEDIYNSISEADIKKLEGMAPTNAKLADFLIQLDALAGRSGMYLTAISFSDPVSVPGARYSSLGVKMSITGTYDSFENYLRDTEQFVRIIDVDNIGFSSPPNSQAAAFLDISLGTRSYITPR